MRDALTFDIVLFKSKTECGRAVRKALGSEYDLIAMVIRTAQEPKEIFLLESRFSSGVFISRFSERKQFLGSHFKRMVHRRLMWVGKENEMQSLAMYCQALDVVQAGSSVNA